MSPPNTILDLAINDEPANGDIDRRLEKGAQMVEDFARQSSLSALDALLELNQPGGAKTVAPKAATRAADIAQEVTQQAAMLHGEVERFLTTKPKR